jgi:hypothetical protein
MTQGEGTSCKSIASACRRSVPRRKIRPCSSRGAARAAGPDSTARNPRRLLELLDRGETPAVTYRAPLVVWRFGEDLTLVALPGETVSGYIPRVDDVVAPDRVWVAGYCNEVFGYRPTARIAAEGGYEDRGLVCEVGLFDAGVEEVIVAGARRLTRR